MNTLLNETKLLLAKADESRKVIANNSGVGYDWLTKFAQGRIPDPGVTRLQKLHDYLKQQIAA